MDETPWNLKELRDYVRRLPGDRQFVLNVISSLDWSDQIFRYHFFEARDTLRAIPIDKDPNSIKNHELMFSSSDEHDWNMLVVRANVIACIHTVRNAYDHLAQLCNALLVVPQIPVEKCDLHKVRDRLPQSALRQELDMLTASQWFKYVAAYSNTSKHRVLVQQDLIFLMWMALRGFVPRVSLMTRHTPHTWLAIFLRASYGSRITYLHAVGPSTAKCCGPMANNSFKPKR